MTCCKTKEKPKAYSSQNVGRVAEGGDRERYNAHAEAGKIVGVHRNNLLHFW